MILTAAGREDIDVRMLGSGRPFILQLEMSKNCRSRDWAQILKNMNADFAANGGYIQFNEESGLTLYEKDDNWLMQELYKGSTEKIKNYRAVVYSKQGLAKKTLETELGKIKDL